MVKFLRTGWKKYSKLGLRRKKKQIYRKSKGIDNKIRLKMKGHLRNVSSGFRSDKKKRSLIEGLRPVVVYNLNDLKKLSDKEIGVTGRVGDKRKKELAEYAKEHKIKLANFNPNEVLKKIEEKIKQKKEKKQKRIEKKKSREKKGKKTKKKDKTEITKTQAQSNEMQSEKVEATQGAEDTQDTKNKQEIENESKK